MISALPRVIQRISARFAITQTLCFAGQFYWSSQPEDRRLHAARFRHDIALTILDRLRVETPWLYVIAISQEGENAGVPAQMERRRCSVGGGGAGHARDPHILPGRFLLGTITRERGGRHIPPAFHNHGYRTDSTGQTLSAAAPIAAAPVSPGGVSGASGQRHDAD